MKHSMMVVMILALLQAHMGEKVGDDWFSQYGEKRDMMAEYPEGGMSGVPEEGMSGIPEEGMAGRGTGEGSLTKTKQTYFLGYLSICFVCHIVFCKILSLVVKAWS